MFIGHFAVGFAAKKFAPNASLTALIFAPLFADILWPVLVAVGAEHVRIAPGDTVYTPLEFVSYPWSHSLLMLALWGLLLGAWYRKKPDGVRSAAVIGLLVVSHWFLDWITHRADMPIYPGGPKYGLGLWNHVGATMIVELALFVAGVAIYVSVTRARNALGRWLLGSLVGLLLGFYLVSSFATATPPSVTAIWISALVGTAVTLLWVAWIDRHRTGAGPSRVAD